VLALARDDPQLAQQRGLHVTEDEGERGLVTGLCLSQDCPERGTDHRTSIGPAASRRSRTVTIYAKAAACYPKGVA